MKSMKLDPEVYPEIVASCGCKSIAGTVTDMCDAHVRKMDGFSVSFTGHRPQKLGTGYSITNNKVIAYSEKLMPILRELIEEGATRFISGGAIGFDQIAFWTVNKLKREYIYLENVVAVPFAKQHTKWRNDELVRYYHQMLRKADTVVHVDELLQYQTDTPIGEYSALKLQKRNEYMVDHSEVVVACFDGTSGGTANCVRYAHDHSRRIIQIKPF